MNFRNQTPSIAVLGVCTRPRVNETRETEFGMRDIIMDIITTYVPRLVYDELGEPWSWARRHCACAVAVRQCVAAQICRLSRRKVAARAACARGCPRAA